MEFDSIYSNSIFFDEASFSFDKLTFQDYFQDYKSLGFRYGYSSPMSQYKPILIGCPQYQRFVRGTYECDETGKYLRTADGNFSLEQTKCGHCGGRCAQTLCVLHRHNRLSDRSWHPYSVLPVQKENVPAKTAPPRTTAAKKGFYA